MQQAPDEIRASIKVYLSAAHLLARERGMIFVACGCQSESPATRCCCATLRLVGGAALGITERGDVLFVVVLYPPRVRGV